MPPFKGIKGFKGVKSGAGRGGPMRLSAASSAARGAALLQTKVTVSSGRPPASSRSITTGPAHQHKDWRTDLFGRPLLRLPTFRQSQATALTAEPLLLEEPQHAASPADGAPVTDAGAQQSSSSVSEASLPLSPRDSAAPAELASAFASAATPSADGLPAAADDQAAHSPAEVAVLAPVVADEEGAAGTAAAPDEARPAEEECSSAAALDDAGLVQLQSTADHAPAEPAEPPQQSTQPLSVHAVSSGSESQPDSPGTPAQATELPRVSVVGADGRPTAERLRDPVLARFLVPQPVAGYLIGTGGARTKQYSERSGAKVWVAGQQFVDVPGMRTVFMQGSLEAVEEAVFMVFTDLVSDGGAKERRKFFQTKDGRDKARMLVPAWLVGTVMGKNAQNIISANAETGALMRFAPAADDTERDRLLEVVAPDVGTLARASAEVMRLCLRNPKYKAVFITPGGVSSQSLTARKQWHDNKRLRDKSSRGAAPRTQQAPAQPSAQLASQS